MAESVARTGPRLRFTWDASALRIINWRNEMSPGDGSWFEGTRMRWSGRVRPKDATRLAGPLITRLGKRQEQRMTRIERT